MGAFVISTKLNGQFKFEFTSRKGKVIFTSSGFAEKEACESAVEQLRLYLDSVEYRRFRTAGGKYYFRMILEGNAIAVSRKYSTELMLQKGISEVTNALPKGEVLDFSGGDELFFR